LKHEWKWLLAIFLTALAYRCLCYGVIGRHPLLTHPVVDAQHHDAWARRIVAGDRLGHGPDDVFKPPGYPYFLAALYSLFSPGRTLVLWTQYMLGALSCVLIAFIAGRLLGRETGHIAGFLSALYAPFVFFESQLLTPALSIFLNLAALALLLSNWNQWSSLRIYLRLLSAGFLFGLSAAVRPDVLLPAGLIVLYLLWRNRQIALRRLVSGAFCIALGAGVVILAVALRNAAITRSPPLISSNAGINFYVGNVKSPDGTSAVPVGIRWERLVSRVPQPILERPAQASRWWFRRAWREIAAAPLPSLRRLGKKALALLNRREFRNNISFHFLQNTAWPLRLPFLQYWIILPLALLGLMWLLRQQEDAAEEKAKSRQAAHLSLLWVGGYWIGGLIFFVTARYRLPPLPLLIIPAAWTLKQIAAARRAGDRRKLAVAGGSIVAVGAICWPLWLGSPEKAWVRDYVNLGNSLLAAGNGQGAEKAFRRALTIEPEDPDALRLLARLLLARGQADQTTRHLAFARQTSQHRALARQAAQRLALARRIIPDSPDLLFESAQASLALRETARTREFLHRILYLQESCNLWPKRAVWARAHLMLADLEPITFDDRWEKAWQIDPATTAEMAFLRRREPVRALNAFRAEAEKKPWDWYSQANYGLGLLRAGRAGEAVIPLGRAAELAPEGKAGVRFQLARALIGAGRKDEALQILRDLRQTLPKCSLRQQIDALLSRLARGSG
jgi:tetratricopeptide (TPR) repeat protein